MRRIVKPLVFALCLAPLARLAWRAIDGDLGANPIEAVTRALGGWALTFLLASLAVTPLRRLSGVNSLIRLRRMLGLFAFFYAALHMSSYVGLDRFFDWRDIAADVVKRPYITIGVTAFVLLVPLAVTSTDGMVRRLGGKRWQRLHRLVYAIAALGVVHYLLLVKADVRKPLVYGGVLAVLLGYRVVKHATRRAAAAGRPRGREPVAAFAAGPHAGE